VGSGLFGEAGEVGGFMARKKNQPVEVEVISQVAVDYLYCEYVLRRLRETGRDSGNSVLFRWMMCRQILLNAPPSRTLWAETERIWDGFDFNVPRRAPA
jgi:hypothetical protein